jgi:lipopolysaccharide assembly outer membrane protein LptD (OstA)
VRAGWRSVALGVVAVALLHGAAVRTATAQDPPPQRPPPQQGQASDSIPQAVDTTVARGLGLPTQPSRAFPQADSIIQMLLEREGYRSTRYAADSLTLFSQTDEIQLRGSALIEREGSILEADSVSFFQADCMLLAGGDPTLFDRETVLVGTGGMSYDTCVQTGIVAQAITKFNQMGVDWYLRGEIAVDSASTRLYGAGTTVTTCNQPNPHFHFSAYNVKWVSNNVMVARPAVLYVRDVPVLWLPFIWQDMREGRRSGILIPRFGFNDLVRPNTGYRRHVSNIGYYFAINDYLDFQASVDWFSGNYVSLNGQLRYNWLNRFVRGNLSLSRVFEEGIEGQPG